MTEVLEQTDERLRSLMREYAQAFCDGPVRSVAVVGNAPMEPSDERAKRIDSCDLVFRVNSFWVDGPDEPASHGTKVTTVVINRRVRATPGLFDHYRRRAYFLTEGGHVAFKRLRRYPTYWPADLAAWPIPNRAVLADLRRAIDPHGTVTDLVVPTTGTAAAHLADVLFPEAQLLLTGFSFLTEPHQTSWSHHRGGTVPVAAGHYIALEGALMQSWIDSGRAEFLSEKGQ
jgi:hypothetical protein